MCAERRMGLSATLWMLENPYLPTSVRRHSKRCPKDKGTEETRPEASGLKRSGGHAKGEMVSLRVAR